MDFRLAIAQQILSALPEAPLEAADVASMLEVPPDTKLGDYAFPCFKLSRVLRMGPPQIAAKLAGSIDAGDLCQLDAINVKPRCDCHSGKCDESECGSYRAK